MKQGSNSRRPRGRSNNNKRSPNRNNNHDSGGLEIRVRGNASQVHEKYLSLARDALSADDRISSENYSQHAEHFYRIMSINAENQKNSPNSSQNNEQTGGQKERSRGRRNRNNNRGNDHVNNQNDDAIVDGDIENKSKRNNAIEENKLDETKIIKEIEIKTPIVNLTEDANDKESDQQKSEPA